MELLNYMLRYVGYTVLKNLELTAHEYVRLQSQQAVNVSWNCSLFLTEMSGVQKEHNKYPVNWLVQHGVKGKVTSFCYKDLYVTLVYWTFMFVRPIFCSTILCPIRLITHIQQGIAQ